MSTTTPAQSVEDLTAAAAAYPVQPHPAPLSDQERAAATTHPKFGTVFTDHMARARWTIEAGWSQRRGEAYGPRSEERRVGTERGPGGGRRTRRGQKRRTAKR